MDVGPEHFRVLVVAPIGRDSRLIREALESAGIRTQEIESVKDAERSMSRENAGALVITEEVLDTASIQILRNHMVRQPTWSHLPILILTVGGMATALSRRREQDRLPLGSVTLLERPIRVATLISSLQSALHFRSRQYQMRDTLRERDAAESARRESESRLLTAIEAARLGSWELNVTSGVFEASPTCRKNFDWMADQELRYEHLVNRAHPEDQPRVREMVRKTTEARVPHTAEFRVIWRDGTVRWISSTGRLLEGERADGSELEPGSKDVRIAGVTMDITDRVLSELALRKADKLALVGRLSSSIAHEINNPLEAVTNLLYLLGTSALPPVEAEYVATAQTELARISEITAQTLRFNRQKDSFQEAVLPEILDSVLALYQGRLATSNIVVQRQYMYRKPVLCHPGEVRQIITNLIGNAFDATRRGGRIVVRERAGLHPVTGERGARITIADTGTGIAPEVKNRLFEAFQSTKGNNGTGLGLWISKGLAEKHRGSLRYSSSTAPGHCGSVFSLFLPLRR